jgi:hypothetical protein
MIGLICFVLAVLASPFKSKRRLEAENAVLRHQLIVLRRRLKGRARLTNNDRWFFVQMYRWFPSILKVITIVQPETLVRRSSTMGSSELEENPCFRQSLAGDASSTPACCNAGPVARAIASAVQIIQLRGAFFGQRLGSHGQRRAFEQSLRARIGTDWQ